MVPCLELLAFLAFYLNKFVILAKKKLKEYLGCLENNLLLQEAIDNICASW
jgi:hypothetical protein